MPTKAIVLLEAEMNIGGIAMNIQTIVAKSFETSRWHPYSFRLLGMVLVHSYTLMIGGTTLICPSIFHVMALSISMLQKHMPLHQFLSSSCCWEWDVQLFYVWATYLSNSRHKEPEMTCTVAWQIRQSEQQCRQATFQYVYYNRTL